MSLPYTQEMLDSVKKVEATRDERLNTLPRRMTAERKKMTFSRNFIRIIRWTDSKS